MSNTLKDLKYVSYCVLSYNQENYIKDCLVSVLNQDYESLEIIISDDNSSDKTWTIIQSVLREYKGKHKVTSYQNSNNLGLVPHYNKVVYNYVQGDYIIILGGDDIAESNHANKAIEYVEQFPQYYIIDFSGVIIDSLGEKVNELELKNNINISTLEDYNNLNTISSFAPGRIMNRKIFEKFPAINSSCPTEDSVLVFRSLLSGGLVRVNEKLIKYRRHENNISSTEGLKLMNNELIIAQYSTDLNHSFTSKNISTDTYKKTFTRLQLQLKLRNLNNEKSKYKRFLKRQFYKIIYRLILKY